MNRRDFFIWSTAVTLLAASKPATADPQPVGERTAETGEDIPSPYPGEPKNTNVLIRLPNDVADGKRDASTAIQQAIDKAAIGGTVEFPPGTILHCQCLEAASERHAARRPARSDVPRRS